MEGHKSTLTLVANTMLLQRKSSRGGALASDFWKRMWSRVRREEGGVVTTYRKNLLSGEKEEGRGGDCRR